MRKWSELAQEVRSVLKQYPSLRLTQGRKVLEIRPIIQWEKGRAIEFLLESLGLVDRKDIFPIYIGNDQTDEDAFKYYEAYHGPTYNDAEIEELRVMWATEILKYVVNKD